jgi:hypothetical protein
MMGWSEDMTERLSSWTDGLDEGRMCPWTGREGPAMRLDETVVGYNLGLKLRYLKH